VTNVSPLPSRAKRWTRLLIGLSVSVPIALAPLLGKLPIPLFPSLLALIPPSIRGVVIPVSAAAMSIVGIASEASLGTRRGRLYKEKMLRRALVYCATLLACFLVAYSLLVTRVEILGGHQFVAFVTGWSLPSKPPCTGLSSAECIASCLTFRESSIVSYFGQFEVAVSTIILEALYCSFFCTLGLAVLRLLELTESHRGQSGSLR
jgi:hypothetical protein